MQLKIVCLNLWVGGKLMPEIIAFLESQDADVVALQEVYNGTSPELEERYRSMAVLRQALGYPYDNYAQSFIHDSPTGMIPQGNGILSKLPIKDHAATFLTEPTKESYQDVPAEWPVLPRMLQHVVLDAGRININLFNIHGVWDMDGDNYSPQRQRMSEITLEKITGLANVVLCGDTNAKPSNQAFQAIEAQLKPVFDPPLITTFNMRRKDNPGYATAAVDLMFISPAIAVISRDCPDVDISDHLPLVVTLQID